MSNEYQFSTFQELFDRVPSDRICECLKELGHLMSVSKATAILAFDLAKIAAEEKGDPFPEMPVTLLQLPPVITWKDDGKGELVANIKDPDGKAHMSIQIGKKNTGE